MKDLSPICQYYGIADMYVFGSRALEVASRLKEIPQSRGQNKHAPSVPPDSLAVQGVSGKNVRAESDVDIGVLPKAGAKLSARERVRLTIELEDLLDVSRVDLVYLPEADPFLALDVIRGELLYAEDPDRQAEYELFVLRRAGDLFAYKRERMTIILEEGGR